MKKINCNLCGSNDYDVIYYGQDRLLHIDKKKFAVVRCKTCSLVYLNPQPEFDELSKYYSEEYSPYIKKEMFKYSKLAKFIKYLSGVKNCSKKESSPFLGKKDDSVKKYLDFGCASGAHLERVRSKHPNWDLYGLDNNSFVCRATEEKGFRVFCGDISNIELPDNFFDHINMGSVIEHVHNPKYTMRRLNQSLKTGGSILIRTPNFRSFARFLFGKYWQALDTPRHLYLFDKNTLNKLLSETGFGVEKIEFKVGPSVEIKSFYYLINKKDRRMSSITWRILRPFTDILAKFGFASTMIVTAYKVAK